MLPMFGFVLMSCMFVVCSAFEAKVVYLSYFSPIGINEQFNSINSTLLPIVSNADDSPMENIPLLWSFPFFGDITGSLWVNSNGGVFVSKSSSCSCDCFDCEPTVTSVALMDRYSGFMTGLFTDLNPGQFNFSVISKEFDQKNCLTVFFDRITFFSQAPDSDVSNTFRIMLCHDGQVSIYYDDVVSSPPFPDYWISGLRPPDQSSNGILYNITKGQEYILDNEWGANSLLGVYPTKTKVTTGSKFVSCPTSMTWTVTPAAADVSNFTSFEVLFSALSLTCTSTLQYAVYVSNSSTSSTASDSDADESISSDVLLSPCAAVSLPTEGLKCSINSSIVDFSNFKNGISTVDYYLHLAWKFNGTGTVNNAIHPNINSYQSVPIDAIPFTFFNSSASNVSVTYPNCTVNVPPVNFTASDACVVAAGNYTPFDLPCNSANDPVLYQFPTCNNICPIYAGNASLVGDYYSLDINGVCCAEKDQDCKGVCYGTDVVGFKDSGLYKCCAVDCLGVCDGNAIVDVCDVCDGKYLL